MKSIKCMSKQQSWLVLACLGLCLLVTMSVPALATAQGAGSMCTIRIFGNGNLMAVFTLPPTNFAIAALVPPDTDVVVPVLCDDLGQLGLGVASQEKNKTVTFNVRVFDHNGIIICNKGGFSIPPRGGTGVTFASCSAP
jgi:hypothetical protein